MLDKEFSTEEYKCYTNKCKDGRLRCLLVFKNGIKKNISFPKLLMERVLGRKLLPNEEVHHKDENPLNNNLDNLEVRFKGEHQAMHSTGKHYTVSEELRKFRSENAKRLWKEGVYANRAIKPKTEEHKKHLSESLLKYYKNKKETN